MTKEERTVLFEVLGTTCDFDFAQIVENIIDRIENIYEKDEEDNLYEKMLYAINDELIYYCDQWTVLEHYSTPQEANWNASIEALELEIYEILLKLRERREK